jgi:hypothetical protein
MATTTTAREGCNNAAASRVTTGDAPREVATNKRPLPFVEEGAARRTYNRGSEANVYLSPASPPASNPQRVVALSCNSPSSLVLPSPAALATTRTSSTIIAETAESAPPETAFYYSSNKTFAFCGENCKELERENMHPIMGVHCEEMEHEYMHPMMFGVHGSFAVYVRFDSNPEQVVMTDAASGTVEKIWYNILPAGSYMSHVAFVRSGKHVVIISQSMRVNVGNRVGKSSFKLVQFFDTETGHPTCFPGKVMLDIEGIASASEAFKVVLWSTQGRISTFRRGGRKDDQPSASDYLADYGEDVEDEYLMYTTSASFFEDDVKVSSCAVSPNGYWCAMSRADGSVAMLDSTEETPFWTEAWLKSFEGTKETDLAFAAAGKLLVCHDRRDKIKLLVAATGLLVGETKLSFPLKGPCVGKPVIVRDHETEAEEDAGTSTTRKSEDVFSIL